MKRLIAVLTALVLTVTSPPQVAYAATVVTFDISKGSVNITDSTYSGRNSYGTRLSGTSSGKVFTITGSTTRYTVTVSGTQNITLSNCSVDVSSTGDSSSNNITGDAAFCIADNNTGNVNVTLVGENTLLSGYKRAGLEKNGGNSTGCLTISGTGKLIVTGGKRAAGIGGGKEGLCSNVTINSGTIIATGGSYYGGAAIGGGMSAEGSNITITGGTVTANGGALAAGIGGGYGGNGSNITISGGTVTATGRCGAGIGGGSYGGDGSDITITGGTVIATSSSEGAGIGGGDNGNGLNITISGGIVTATGGTDGAGIGGGDHSACSNIIISGGVVIATGGNFAAGIGDGPYGNGSNINISGGTVTATGGDQGAGIGSGSGTTTSFNSTIITGGSVKAVAGKCGGHAIGGGIYGVDKTPTDGNGHKVYLLTIPNQNSKPVYIDGVSYTQINHTAADPTDTNLYVYLTYPGQHTVTCGETTNTYAHLLYTSYWYTPTSVTINYGQSLSSSAIQSTVISEDGSSVSGSWLWVSPTTIPSNAGTFTYTAKFTTS